MILEIQVLRLILCCSECEIAVAPQNDLGRLIYLYIYIHLCIFAGFAKIRTNRSFCGFRREFCSSMRGHLFSSFLDGAPSACETLVNSRHLSTWWRPGLTASKNLSAGNRNSVFDMANEMVNVATVNVINEMVHFH